MANQHRSTVNQRLYFARLHLDWLKRELDSEQLPAMTVEQALGESLLFHLCRTYQTYLLEVAETYALFPQQLENATAFKVLLAEQGKSSAQANELAALECSGSWLSAMLQSSTSALLPAQAVPAKGSIAVIQIESTNDAGASNTELLGSYLDKLAALIENQRGHLEEW